MESSTGHPFYSSTLRDSGFRIPWDTQDIEIVLIHQDSDSSAPALILWLYTSGFQFPDPLACNQD